MSGYVKVEVIIKFVGIRSSSGMNETQIEISTDYKTGIKEIRDFVKEHIRMKSYILYKNDLSVIDSQNNNETESIRNGDVFKIIPVMSGG